MKNIFERMLSGEAVPMDDPEYGQIREAVNKTLEISVKMNAATHVDEVRKYLSQILGAEIDESTTIFPPFHTNIGRNISLGKNVFINHGCSFLDLGGITIEDGVMIAPRVNISSENHPVEIEKRNTLVPKAVTIKKNAWIGANATILPGVTIGENAVVAAGAVVTKDVEPNSLVGGVPAKLLKKLVP
ncbi:DapH/DapD/GlmU-related protein [Luteirhabdus pelagi]|uniref:DapH/DapD/GlmU-related protein n=1 Tax=Luteirhabdus pelagi TaxID=2792783 RepID=UPI00193A5D21|nr:DapH/DapD/GlmU-related protein [Luteirhabdus pelagi]